jgi:hypothetical protein
VSEHIDDDEEEDDDDDEDERVDLTDGVLDPLAHRRKRTEQ